MGLLLEVLLWSQSASCEGQLPEDRGEGSSDRVGDGHGDCVALCGSGALAALMGRGVVGAVSISQDLLSRWGNLMMTFRWHQRSPSRGEKLGLPTLPKTLWSLPDGRKSN